jgi:branched-chain amino acid transport system substrate-binding protein
MGDQGTLERTKRQPAAPWCGAPMKGRKMRSHLLAVAVAAAMVALAPSATRAAEPFTINVILSLTGYAAFIGQQEQVGLRALENVTNRSGGINGTPVHFEIVDDASNPANAVQLANQIVAKNVAVIMGPSLTSNCESVFPRILDNGPVTYCFSPALYPKPDTFGFSVGPSTRDLNVAAVRYFRSQGWKRVALLTTTDASGQDGERQGLYTMGLAENKGMQLVANEHFAVSDLTIAAQVAKIKDARPDVVLAWVTGTPSGTALRGLHEGGLDVPVLLNAGNINAKQIQGYAAFMPKTLLFPGLLFMAPEMTKNALVRNEQRRFVDALKALDAPPVILAALAYDPARIIVDTFRHNGTNATAKQIRDYIEHIKNVPGVNGIMNYTDGSQRGIGADGVVIVRWNEAKQNFVPISRPGGQPT